VATGLGAFLRITPWALVPAAAVWIALVASLRFVSLASICAVAGLPVAILALGYPPALALAGLAVAVIIIGRHHENLGRLLAGKESRFGERAAAASVPAPPPTGDHR
jgi:glycerol-3-phosphate acyltransferase PlsY